MASPAGPSRRERQLLADSSEQLAVNVYVVESRRPLRWVMAEILRDGVRAAESRARLEAILEHMAPGPAGAPPAL